MSTSDESESAEASSLRVAGEGDPPVARISNAPPKFTEPLPAAFVTGAARQKTPLLIAFNRRELDQILRVYGRHVASGEWRDYAIDHLKDRAVFSVFRRTSEAPLFRVEKAPRLARKQGTYSVVAHGGMILKRGHDLEKVLRVLDKRRHLSLV